MIQIAVCDDEKVMAEKNRQLVRQAASQEHIACDTAVYTDGKALLYDIAEDGFFYDLLLLDIEMPGISGMELVSKIKPSLPDVKVIFITSHIEYAVDAFELSIFRYVPKAELNQRLVNAAREALRLIALEDGRTYTVSDSRRLERIPYRDILYIQKDGKNSCIYSPRGPLRVRKSLQTVYGELSAPEFLFLDRGCIANLIHIMQVRDGMALLKNGELLPISRSHLAGVKELINQYWGEHIG